jgi:hypothetical protein
MDMADILQGYNSSLRGGSSFQDIQEMCNRKGECHKIFVSAFPGPLIISFAPFPNAFKNSRLITSVIETVAVKLSRVDLDIRI